MARSVTGSGSAKDPDAKQIASDPQHWYNLSNLLSPSVAHISTIKLFTHQHTVHLGQVKAYLTVLLFLFLFIY